MPGRDAVWVVHDDPVIRERENYIANVNLNAYGLDGQYEQLWLRRLARASPK
jgi:hypothetical protein